MFCADLLDLEKPPVRPEALPRGMDQPVILKFENFSKKSF
jgi:hypothetical protein